MQGCEIKNYFNKAITTPINPKTIETPPNINATLKANLFVGSG